MTDIEVQVEVQPNSPEQHAFGGLQEDMSGEMDSDCRESLNTGQGGQIYECYSQHALKTCMCHVFKTYITQLNYS